MLKGVDFIILALVNFFTNNINYYISYTINHLYDRFMRTYYPKKLMCFDSGNNHSETLYTLVCSYLTKNHWDKIQTVHYEARHPWLLNDITLEDSDLKIEKKVKKLENNEAKMFSGTFDFDFSIKEYKYKVFVYEMKTTDSRGFVGSTTPHIDVEYTQEHANTVFMKAVYNDYIATMTTDRVLFYNDKDCKWCSKPNKLKKSYNTLFLSKKNKELLLSKITDFTSSTKYDKLQIPKKLAILLHGIPGSGKSATIFALAHELKRNIFSIDITTITVKHLHDIHENSIVVIEDIERQLNIMDLDLLKQKDKMVRTLMNFLDGYDFPDNIIIILTSNDPELIDKVMLRPGRINLKLEYGYCDKDQFEEICAKWPELKNKFEDNYQTKTTAEILNDL